MSARGDVTKQTNAHQEPRSESDARSTPAQRERRADHIHEKNHRGRVAHDLFGTAPCHRLVLVALYAWGARTRATSDTAGQELCREALCFAALVCRLQSSALWRKQHQASCCASRRRKEARDHSVWAVNFYLQIAHTDHSILGTIDYKDAQRAVQELCLAGKATSFRPGSDTQSQAFRSCDVDDRRRDQGRAATRATWPDR